MTNLKHLLPGPDHPISIQANPNHVIARYHDRVVADTHHAMTLKEASYPPVQYVPREDADLTVMRPTDHHTHCPYKGDASYHSIVTPDSEADNAVWSYEEPYEVAKPIQGYFAFYPDVVEITEHPVQ
ncbi:MAG TPA: DUF427 domain-containing protein [Fimbriimonas sp.]|nr:DUF427 domain-containing protein [Fimbriimonas sp.]